MDRDFDFSAYAEQVRELTERELRGVRSAAAIGRARGRVVALAEETLAAHSRDPEHIACRAGCGTCCCVNVSVLFPEALSIAAYVRGEFSGEAFSLLKERIDRLYTDSRWLDDEERVFLRRPCAFLTEEQACAIYPVRPLLCRSVTSTDPEVCLQAIALPALGEGRPVLMNLFQKSLMSTTYEAMGLGLEASGLDARGVRLTEAVKAFLEEPELAQEFCTGRRIAL